MALTWRQHGLPKVGCMSQTNITHRSTRFARINLAVQALLLVSAASLLPACSAEAGPADDQPPPDWSSPPPMGPEAQTQSLEQLFKQLNLQPQQLPLWQTYAKRVEDFLDLRYREQPALASHTAPQQLKRLVLIQQNRLAALESIEDAARALYDKLTPEQRKKADAQLLRTVPIPQEFHGGDSSGSGRGKPSGPPGGGKGPRDASSF